MPSNFVRVNVTVAAALLGFAIAIPRSRERLRLRSACRSALVTRFDGTKVAYSVSPLRVCMTLAKTSMPLVIGNAGVTTA